MSSKPNKSGNNDHLDPDQLQAYLDGALEGNLIHSFERHLQDCSDCQRKLSKMENLVAQLESLPEIALQNDFSQSILSSIQKTREVPKELTWTLLIEAAAAGVILGLVIPILRSTGWVPDLSSWQISIGTALQVYLTQLVSRWMVWWAGLQLNISQFLKSSSTALPINTFLPSPWILILVGIGVGLIVNFILLRPDLSVRKNGI